MGVAEEIFKIRTKLGLTQKEFARKMNRDQRTICSYEKGRIEPPLDFFMELTKKFNLKIKIGTDISIEKENLDTAMDLKMEIYNFLISNVVDEDFLKDELINYETIILKYKDMLPKNFIEYISSNNIDTSKIVGTITKDEFSQLGLYYMGEKNAVTILYCSEENNIRWEENPRIQMWEAESNVQMYSYDNPLLLVYIQRDFDIMSKEDFIIAFYSCICSIDILGDISKVSFEAFNVEELKKYLNDMTLIKDEFKVARSFRISQEGKRSLTVYPLIESCKYSYNCDENEDIVTINSSDVIATIDAPWNDAEFFLLKPEVYSKMIEDFFK